MRVCRMDLDGSGSGSPEGLVALILKREPELAPPIPIERLCKQLDITEISELKTEGFEGALITDSDKHSGIILVNRASNAQRRRFTIGHELGHFLIPTHTTTSAAGFQCTRADMMQQDIKPGDRHSQIEVEANRFSSLILIPPPFLRAAFRKRSSPDIAHVLELAREFDVSKDAMARAYANYHPDLVAVIVIQNGQVLRHYRNRKRFPFIQVAHGQNVPRASLYHQASHELNVPTKISECVPDLWIDVKRGQRAPTLFEQIYPQRNGFALMMLHLEQTDEDDATEEEELQHSWTPRFRR